ncbi:PilW family protein [Vibrio rotiferianus]|jgi:prepilin-type N-terminal cleavage/methylation domain-containing protein|uniref:PilW family protein n=1 Tax=Vibrio rotiferianus TaxID=190895 RepID=UPI002895EF38|nr:conserved hypothetical protein [Vibrio rotiferianus]CAH1570956.1 conserved hypothetical protein [Vibrio rotiferianus]
MKQKGFTLVEMLVASVIMMAVLLIASSSYGFFHDRWFKDKNQFYTLVVQKKSQLMMLDVLNGALPYLVKGDSKASYFFEGDRDQFEAVSDTPIFGSKPAMIQLSVQAVGDGTYQILYKEAPITDSSFARTSSKPAFKYEKVLFENLTVAGFRYLGWQSLEEKNHYLDEFEGKPTWNDDYSAQKVRTMPVAIAFTIGDEVLRFLLPEDNSYMLNFSTDTWDEA